jgi:hypothetical protein
MKKKVLIVVNNLNWTSFDSKISAIRNFFDPVVKLQIDIRYTSFINIPMEQINNLSDGSTGKEEIVGGFVFSKTWLNSNVMTIAGGYDYVVFAVNRTDISNPLHPWGIQDGNLITLFGALESDTVSLNGISMGDYFTIMTCHELSHAFFSLLGGQDYTHQYFYSGNPQGVLPILKNALDNKINIIKSMLKILQEWLALLLKEPASPLYEMAKSCLNTSLVPLGDDPELGCAISVNALVARVKGHQVGGGTSTYGLLQALVASSWFKEVKEPTFGDIIISATETSTIPNTPIAHGHTGVVGKYGIMSNDSSSGLWKENYTLDTWKARYETLGGYPTRFFRLIQ